MGRPIILLDGGMGQELVRRAPEAPTPLWSAQVMLDHPEIVRAVHAEYLAAGARMLTLNAYSATRERLAPHGMEHRFTELQALACQLAVDARAGDPGRTLAGCLPPLQWSYRPELAHAPDEAAVRYAEIARLQAPFVDVMLCETIGSIDEARGAVRGAGAAGKPVWLAFTVDDEDGSRLRSGEPLADAVAALNAEHAPAAMLVNCSRPEAIDRAASILASGGAVWGAYANGFVSATALGLPGNTVAALSTRRDLGPDAYADHAMGWVAAGASIIGGCCEVGPAHIRRLDERLREAGHTPVSRLDAPVGAEA